MRNESRLHAVVVACVAALCCGLSWAAEKSAVMDSRTLSYVLSEPMIKAMRDIGLQQDGKLELLPDCRSDYTVDTKDVSVIVLRPIVFSGDKRDPIEGAWQTRFPLKRCGESKYYNVVFSATPGAAAAIGIAYFHPGTSLADVTLVRDAMSVAWAMAAANSENKGCSYINMLDMDVTEQPHDVVENGATLRGVWKEKWTFLACGTKVDVPMKFVPDADGGGTSYFTDNAKQ
jgi:hypothetical protein